MTRYLSLALVCVLAGAPAFAQAPVAPRGGRAAAADGVSPAEVQRMFDAYALMQAQEQLKISDEQYARFLSRFKALQDVRRKAVQERQRIVQTLRKMLNTPAGAAGTDDAQLREQMKALQDLDARTAIETRKASDAVDEVLTTAQQAKFRVFEENMERRKLELVSRARQANRPRNHL
jgi:Spy/CpxP family protein refolding chaperone